MSGTVSLTLAILLFSLFLDKKDTPPIIYITGGFLFAMFAWQVQIFIRTRMLKKQLLNKSRDRFESANEKILEKTNPKKILNEADFTDYVPVSVTELTTEKLKVEK